MDNSVQKKRVLQLALFVSVLVMGIKVLAWLWTGSNAILSDALESIVNLVAGSFALYSVIIAGKPKDESHPYGHGKIEFLSAGLEGTLIAIAGTAILVKAIYNFWYPQALHSVDVGLWLTLLTGGINFIMGQYLQKSAHRLKSLTLEADGKHLSSDAWSSAGLGLGLLLIWLTGLSWMDNAIAVIMGLYILFTGYQLMRKSLAGVMDEADYVLIEQLITILNQHRQSHWVDVHNFRVIKYGADLHIDCHVTLPWYLSLQEAHQSISEVEKIIGAEAEHKIELFIHADPCLTTSCAICTHTSCQERLHPFQRQVTWKLANVLPNVKHHLGTE